MVMGNTPAFLAFVIFKTPVLGFTLNSPLNWLFEKAVAFTVFEGATLGVIFALPPDVKVMFEYVPRVGVCALAVKIKITEQHHKNNFFMRSILGLKWEIPNIQYLNDAPDELTFHRNLLSEDPTKLNTRT